MDGGLKELEMVTASKYLLTVTCFLSLVYRGGKCIKFWGCRDHFIGGWSVLINVLLLGE